MKTTYHHGELRQALIDAARHLIAERQGNDFSLSDACRRAGVSTAAPYRHFPDKTAIINEVVAQGFADMGNQFRAATAAFPAGTPTASWRWARFIWPSRSRNRPCSG
ncbi:MAG: TetR/AcrR family transcriptional regulator [Rhodobacteraceae bacterium]|nr:TetR/AcrR family transcriptional regulator [Paracoccaceae bacterium]